MVLLILTAPVAMGVFLLLMGRLEALLFPLANAAATVEGAEDGDRVERPTHPDQRPGGLVAVVDLRGSDGAPVTAASHPLSRSGTKPFGGPTPP